jgi:hypothetical protein
MPRRDKKPRGRPTLLTPDRQARLFDIVKKGNHLTTACAVVGIGVSTMYRWLEDADEAEAIQNEDGHITPRQQACLEFRDGLRLARAYAEMRAVSVIERSMEGGALISERPLQNSEGELVMDPVSGEPMYERTFTQPDGRLALNYLARSAPHMWGQNVSTGALGDAAGGVAGGGGAAGGGLSEDDAARLSAQLAEVEARRREDAERDRLELEAGVEDAVIVEEAS